MPYTSGYETFTNHIGEKDDYFTNYKEVPEPYTQDDYNADRELDARNAVGQSEKNLENWSTSDLIKKLYKLNGFVVRCETTDYLFDIKHDGDYDAYADETRRYKNAKATINKILDIFATRDDLDELHPSWKASIEKRKEANAKAAEKKAAWIAKQKTEEAEIAEKVKKDPLGTLLEALDRLYQKDPDHSLFSFRDMPEPTPEGLLIALDKDHILNSETGLFYERKSWGYVKQFLDFNFWKSTDNGKEVIYYGKVLKAIWVMQFGSK